jgi:Uncharacterized protein conserved in bacteria (DUF2188)
MHALAPNGYPGPMGKTTIPEQKRVVRPTDRGSWAVCIPGSRKAVVVLPSRSDAVARAKRILSQKGGGNVEVEQDGQVVDVHQVRRRPGNVGGIPVTRRAYRH